MDALVVVLISSPARCGSVATPGEAKLGEPGWALACAISSPKVLNLESGGTTATIGTVPSTPTMRKSLIGSNVRLLNWAG